MSIETAIVIAMAMVFGSPIIMFAAIFLKDRLDPDTQSRDYWLASNYPGLFPKLYRRYRKRIILEQAERIKGLCKEINADPSPFLKRYAELGDPTGKVIYGELYKKLFSTRTGGAL